MKKSITLYESDDFESWTFKKDSHLWVHLIDRGITIEFPKDEFEQFYQRIKKTRQELRTVQE